MSMLAKPASESTTDSGRGATGWVERRWSAAYPSGSPLTVKPVHAFVKPAAAAATSKPM